MSTIRQQQFIEEAKYQANKSTFHFRHGAIIVHGNRIISTGYNRYILTCYRKKRITVHAEMDAINNCPPSFLKTKQLQMYVVRIGLSGNLLNSRPCDHCTRQIEKKGIKVVRYSV